VVESSLRAVLRQQPGYTNILRFVRLALRRCSVAFARTLSLANQPRVCGRPWMQITSRASSVSVYRHWIPGRRVRRRIPPRVRAARGDASRSRPHVPLWRRSLVLGGAGDVAAGRTSTCLIRSRSRWVGRRAGSTRSGSFLYIAGTAVPRNTRCVSSPCVPSRSWERHRKNTVRARRFVRER